MTAPQPQFAVTPDAIAARDEIRRIAGALLGFQFRYATEDDLQQGLAAALEQLGVAFEREVRLDRHCRIDLLCGRVGIEVKVAGDRDTVLRQVRRYLASDLVDGLILVTCRVRHLFPDWIDGKPLGVIQLAGFGL